MKTIFLLLSISLTSALAQPQVQASSCRDIDRIARQVADDWKDGYNSGNAEKVVDLYSEDAYYLTQHFVTGIVQGRANIRAYVQGGIDAKYHVDSIQILSTDCAGDMAYSVDRYESTNAGQKAFGVNIVVIKRIGNNWRIVAHESAVPDPATASSQFGLELREGSTPQFLAY